MAIVSQASAVLLSTFILLFITSINLKESCYTWLERIFK